MFLSLLCLFVIKKEVFFALIETMQEFDHKNQDNFFLAINNMLISLVLVFSGVQKSEGTSQSAWGILKSPDKGSKLRDQDPSLARTNQDRNTADKNDGMRFSRVSFRLENEVFGADDLEAEADSEVKAITGTDGESPGVDEVGYSTLNRSIDQSINQSISFYFNNLKFNKLKKCTTRI